jgi:FtsP/CotA-like multicopper oxidase with cupredoxin domain
MVPAMAPSLPHGRFPGGVSRRAVLAGLGLACTVIALPRNVSAQASSGETAPDGFRVLRARPGEALLRGDGQAATAIWGYDGLAPGPTLRVKRGGELKVRLVNELPEPTLVHWHGLRIPNAMDGVPHLVQEPIAPGRSFDYRFKAPDAGTFWYHSHLYASEQIERGLVGILLVDEPQPVDVDRDIALVFDDWRLRPDGALHEESFRSMHDAAHLGRVGEHLTVNGRPALDIAVRANERLRLRLINAANARLMALRLDGHQAVVMAIDGQPAEPFAARDARVALGPGNRVDLFVDAALAPGASAPLLLETGTAAVPIARLAYDAGAPARPEPRAAPQPLPPNPLPERMDFARAVRVDVPLQGGAMRMHERPRGGGDVPGHGIDPLARIWTMAGQASSGHHGPPLFSVKRGRTVMLAFPNRTAFPHAMHLHGHHFRLLDALDDGWKPFWLDTVVVPPDQTWRIAFVADNPGKWMLHCHMLEHGETGMGAWFEVT